MSRPTRINHVAMAVPSIERFLEANDALVGGFERSALMRNEAQRVDEQFLSDGHTTIELLQPLAGGQGSPLASFLERNRRGGLIHLAYDVRDIEATCAALRARGGRVIVEPMPDVAFPGRRIAFVMLDGQVSELIEEPATR